MSVVLPQVVGATGPNSEGRSPYLSEVSLSNVEGAEVNASTCDCMVFQLAPGKKITYALLHAEGVQVGRIAQDVEEADQVYAFLCHESPRMEGGIM